MSAAGTCTWLRQRRRPRPGFTSVRCPWQWNKKWLQAVLEFDVSACKNLCKCVGSSMYILFGERTDVRQPISYWFSFPSSQSFLAAAAQVWPFCGLLGLEISTIFPGVDKLMPLCGAAAIQLARQVVNTRQPRRSKTDSKSLQKPHFLGTWILWASKGSGYIFFQPRLHALNSCISGVGIMALRVLVQRGRPIG